MDKTAHKRDVEIRLLPGRQEGVCKGCNRRIVWMETLTGKRMPMNSHAMPRHAGDGYDVYAASDSHWATCSQRAQFDKRTKRVDQG